MSYISGEIRSGEHWDTDKTPVALTPVILSVYMNPNPVVKSGSLFIQVFVHEELLPIE